MRHAIHPATNAHVHTLTELTWRKSKLVLAWTHVTLLTCHTKGFADTWTVPPAPIPSRKVSCSSRFILKLHLNYNYTSEDPKQDGLNLKPARSAPLW